jgi:hypothetical protein
MWVKNTKGEPDAMLTFAVIAFALVIFNLFLATFGAVTIMGLPLTFTALGAGTITALLGPTLTAYVGRRFTGAAYPGAKLGLPGMSLDGSGSSRPPEELPEELPEGALEPLDDFVPTGDR